MEQEKIYEGSCFCGAVQFTVEGEPAVMGYCHCDSCRHWSAGPVNAFSLWKPNAVRVTRGADLIGTYTKTPRSNRKWCKACGGHVFNEHPGWGLIDVYAHPPESPDECIFAKTTTTISADLTTRITPCQFGGTPDCSNCGCIASAGLAAVGRHQLFGLIPVGRIFDGSLKLGARVKRLRPAEEHAA